MITIPIEDFIFAVATLVGGVLLLITVVFDDILGGILDAFGLEVGGTSVTPLLLGFIAMFGAGGLLATQVFDIHGGQAALVATVFGIVGAGIAGGLFAWLRRSESEEPFSLEDLVGEIRLRERRDPGRSLRHRDGARRRPGARVRGDLAAEVPSGSTVSVVGVAGTGLIVEAAAPTPASQPQAQ